MKKRRIAIGTVIVALLALLLDALLQFASNELQNQQKIDEESDPTTVEDSTTPDDESALIMTATVTRIVDGDTIVVMTSAQEEIVRLMGINTPETVAPGKKVECFGPEASEALKSELPEGQMVTLFRDETQNNRDKYNRLLRYVEKENGHDVGLWLVQNGYAKEYTYDAGYVRNESYKDAEKAAREKNLGLWGKICENE